MRHARLAALLLMSLPVLVSSEERLTSPAGEIIVRPLGHAAVAVHVGERVIYVDPLASALVGSVPRSDLVLVTEADAAGRHLDRAAIQRVRAPGGAVVVPAAGWDRVPDAVVMRNGDRSSFGDVSVEAIAAYDIMPGLPFRPKGVANGYVLTIGNRRLLVSGATECVPELREVRDIDVAFIALNLPHGRMGARALAECLRAVRPAVTYPYLYGGLSSPGSLPTNAGNGSIDSMLSWLRATLSDITAIRTIE